MIAFDEALNLVLENKKEFGVEKISLLNAQGRILAQDVVADRDLPPFNRVMMDGIAINSATFHAGHKTFVIENVQAAGTSQQKLQDRANCIEVMTGAVLPGNTDAIIPYEQCEIIPGKARIKAVEVFEMQHVHLQGTDCKAGRVLLMKGETITPAMVGILASVGLSSLDAVQNPKIAICSTGDELVAVSSQPQPHQVRCSNIYMLAAALLSEGIQARLVHLPDEPEHMTREIRGLMTEMDVILFSGAVSKGKFDYLPAVLNELGLQQVFHTVAQRPGKPFLFGKFSEGPLIFGFPGNPVSTFVCYHQFFKRWLHQSMHCKHKLNQVVLDEELIFKPALSSHQLVTVTNRNGVLYSTPVTGSSSGDLVTLTQADGLITLPANRDLFNKGELFELNLIR